MTRLEYEIENYIHNTTDYNTMTAAERIFHEANHIYKLKKLTIETHKKH